MVLATAAISCQKDGMKIDVYKIDTGYGYKITQNGKILIKQNTIPSEPGGKKFCDSLDALKVGTEVMKLLHYDKVPAITGDDLNRLNIKLKC